MSSENEVKYNTVTETNSPLCPPFLQPCCQRDLHYSVLFIPWIHSCCCQSLRYSVLVVAGQSFTPFFPLSCPSLIDAHCRLVCYAISSHDTEQWYNYATSWYAKTCHDTAQNITASQAAMHRGVPHQTPIDDELE